MEGGAIVCHDAATKKRIDYLKNFGFAGETKVMAPGINSKMNEMQAALGLLQLKYHNLNIGKRKIIAETYRKEFSGIKGISLLPEPIDTESNYAYFSIFVNEKEYGISRDGLYERLKKHCIYGRRYFYPLISEFPMYRGLESAKPGNLSVAKKMADSVICLPIYPGLSMDTISMIVEIIKTQK